MKAFFERHRSMVLAFWGGVAGYLLLSPLVMLLSDHVHKALTWEHFLAMHGDWRISIKEVFNFSLWPWSLAFTLFGALLGGILSILEGRIAREKAEKSQIFEAAPDGMWLIDFEHNVLQANQRLSLLTGLASEITQGKKCYEIFKGPECRTPKCPLALIRQGKEWIEMEIERGRRDGTRFSCLLTASPLKRPDGRIIGIIEDFRDISGYKRLEEELWQSQKMEAIGQITGGVAHDFNNILVGILGYADLGETKVSPHDPSYKYFGKIKKQAERAADVINQILAFSRRRPLAMQSLNLNTLVSEFKDFLSVTLGKNIDLQIRLAPRLRAVRGDITAMQQIILNLCLNARDAMPQGGKLFIKTQNGTLDDRYRQTHPWIAPGDYVLLTVSDTGCGLDEKTRKRIFEPFFTTKEPGKGTGLGLAVVYGLVKQHQGMIQVHSEPRKGASFEIYLPAISARPASPESGIQEKAGRGTETILVADDEEHIRELVADALCGQGYKVFTAVDGEEATRLFKEHHKEIKLIVLDINMPKKNGPEAYKLMRDLIPDIRCIFITGQSARNIQELSAPGAAELLLKPFDARTLVKKVRSVLDSRL